MRTEFTANQFGRIYPDGIENHWWHIARSRIVARELSRMCPGQRVLDVGCGRGVTLLHLRRRGVDCHGAEPASVEPLPGAEPFVFTGVKAEELEEGVRRTFRAVLLLDVIEHLPDPSSFLQGIARAYPDLRCVILTVPARPELWTNYDEFNGHYRRYTMGMIEDLARGVPWEILRRRYLFRAMYPPMRYLAWSGRRRSTRIAAPRGLLLPVHQVLAGALLLESRLPLGNLPGSSILATFAAGPRPTADETRGHPPRREPSP